MRNNEGQRESFPGNVLLFFFYNSKKYVREMINSSLELSPCVLKVMNCYPSAEQSRDKTWRPS